MGGCQAPHPDVGPVVAYHAAHRSSARCEGLPRARRRGFDVLRRTRRRGVLRENVAPRTFMGKRGIWLRWTSSGRGAPLAHPRLSRVLGAGSPLVAASPCACSRVRGSMMGTVFHDRVEAGLHGRGQSESERVGRIPRGCGEARRPHGGTADAERPWLTKTANPDVMEWLSRRRRRLRRGLFDPDGRGAGRVSWRSRLSRSRASATRVMP